MIDIRELRINNTVWFNDKRVKITAIDNTDDVPFVKTSFRDDKWLHAKLIDPIPITEELLKELGFKKNNTDLDLDYEKFPKDRLGIFIKGIKENLIRVEIWDNVIKKGDMLCQYLHELETFVYLTTKKELKYDKSNQY